MSRSRRAVPRAFSRGDAVHRHDRHRKEEQHRHARGDETGNRREPRDVLVHPHDRECRLRADDGEGRDVTAMRANGVSDLGSRSKSASGRSSAMRAKSCADVDELGDRRGHDEPHEAECSRTTTASAALDRSRVRHHPARERDVMRNAGEQSQEGDDLSASVRRLMLSAPPATA